MQVVAIVSLALFLEARSLTDVSLRSLVGYSRLVMFSFGFQQAFHRGIQAGDDLFFNKVRAVGVFQTYSS